MLTRRELLRSAAQVAAAAPFLGNASIFAAPPMASFIGHAVFNRLTAKAASDRWAALPMGDLVGTIGYELLGTPYVGFTLELDDSEEVCAINLDGLDCVTFFESALNFARILKLGDPSEVAFLRAVRQTRYRGGRQTDYLSRLHYTTDWFLDNVRKGIVEDITPRLPGAAPFTQTVGYMSANPNSYRQLKAHPEWLPRVAQMENAINARSRTFLPMDVIAAAEPLIQTGDIIGVCTTQPGIDIAHTGLAYRDAGGLLHFLDASSAPSRMKVSLEGRLSHAVAWSRRNTGIIVARPLEPRVAQ